MIKLTSRTAWITMGMCFSGAVSAALLDAAPAVNAAGPDRLAVSPRARLAATQTVPSSPSGGSMPSIIPLPATVSAAAGAFSVSAETPIVAAGGEAERIARYFADLTSRTRSIPLNVRPGAGGKATGGIEFVLDSSTSAGAHDAASQASVASAASESYELTISPSDIRVRARDAHGLFYGAITLWSLITADPSASKSSRATLESMTITDAPRFAWRGFLLDSARHYQSVAYIKQLLDWMALHKLNTFHWHLTDDEGWRLEIKKYPRLTEVGAWRVPAGAGPAADIDPKTNKLRVYGGYYTQDQVREVVRYAADRFITVVPEIEMPGHAQAAIAAYARLGTDVVAPPVSSDWGVHTYLYNVDDSTFAFLEDVLTEVMGLFPGTYIHTGGDEAVKDRWRSSPAIQARMRDLGVADEIALQSYFTHRIEAFLSSHGRKLIGWDEILEGGLPRSATVMSWRGTEGAIEASKAGHDVVMSPAPSLYLDYLQSDSSDEPPGRPNYVTLQDMYSFNVVPDAIGAESARHVLGAQVNAWTEHMRITDRLEHAAFPRLAAFAEVVWSQKHGTWQDFVNRLPAQFARYRTLGIHYADSAFAVKFAGSAKVQLSNQANVGEIRYTLDGSEPTRTSARYSEPFALPSAKTVKAATFIDGQRVSSPRVRTFDRASALRRNDDELRSCSKKLVLRLEDDAPRTGERAVFNVDILDPCWIWEKADLAGVTGIAASVGQVPFNFQVGDAVKQIVLYPPETAAGELEVRKDSCDGERIAVLPLAVAATNFAVTSLPRVQLAKSADAVASTGASNGARKAGVAGSGTLGVGDVHDLCLRFTRRAIDPIWALKSVQLFE